MAVDGGGRGGFEFECFGAGPLVGAGFANEETFGFEGFDAERVGVCGFWDAEVRSWSEVLVVSWLGGGGACVATFSIKLHVARSLTCVRQ